MNKQLVNSMKRILIFLLVFIIFFSIIPSVQAADQQGLNYTSLKNEYIQNHLRQTIIPFPWEPSSSIRVLPFNYEIPAAPANNFSITACRDQFESASFIINAQKNISSIEIFVPDLLNDQGNKIPSDAINVRTVKAWYQADDKEIWVGDHPGSSWLIPELLLKDDSLVKVDYSNKVNYLKVTIDDVQQYIDISNPNATFPSNAQIRDTPSLQPFSLQTNENKQIWMTVHIPSDTPAGNYYGDIIISTPSEIPVIMNFEVKVLPFDLEPSSIEYSIYYEGTIPPAPREGINSEWKTPQQYSIELQNMKEHGILYPTFSQAYETYNPWNQSARTALSLRNQAGFPNDHIYVKGYTTQNWPDPIGQTNLAQLANRAIQWKNITSKYGYKDVFFYGIDEASSEILRSERPAWQAVHNNGVKVFVAVSDNNDAVNIVGDLLDVAIFAGPLNTTQATKWHSFGKRIFSYANPQVGVENPEIYRKNYGFALWNAGYDGAMDWAYQGGYGNIWNDFDKGSEPQYRDHVFAYPTSDGVIDTIQWEGWREGVDDTRYLATLMKTGWSNTSVRTLITGSLSNGEDMATIREKVIDQILLSYPPTPTPTITPTPTPAPTPPTPPTAQFTANITQGKAPLTVQFTDQSVSTGTTTYKWNVNNDGTVDYTTPNPTYTYRSAGVYTVNLTVTNSAGSASEVKTNYITVTAAPEVNPIFKTGVYRPGVGFFLKMDNGNTWNPLTDQFLPWDKAAVDRPIACDWNADGIDEVGVYRPGVGFFLKMDNGSSWKPSTDRHLAWDNAAGDLPIAGDWNMDGRAETGVYRPGAGFYLKMDNTSSWKPSTDLYLAWDNAAGDLPIAGDWNMDSRAETGVYRPGAGFYLKMDNTSTWKPSTDLYLAWDNAVIDLPVAGDWNADGRDETGVYRPGAGFYLKMDNSSTWNPSSDQYLAWDNAKGDLPVAGNFV